MPESGEPDDAFAVWVVRAEEVEDKDLESLDSYELAVVACRSGIDLTGGPGGSIVGLDDDDVAWRSWVIAEIENRQDREAPQD